MHCARWGLSCLPPLFMGERRTYICPPPLFIEERRTYICPPFCERANEQDHCLILWSVRSLYHTGLLQDFLYPQPRNKKKCSHGNTCCQILLKPNQLLFMQGFAMQRIHKNISPRNRTEQATLVARCCWQTNQLQSVQGYGKQRTHKNTCKSKKQKKVLPWQHLLPGIVEKLISSNPSMGLECKEPKDLKAQETWKSVAMLPGDVEKLISSNLHRSMESIIPDEIMWLLYLLFVWVNE